MTGQEIAKELLRVGKEYGGMIFMEAAAFIVKAEQRAGVLCSLNFTMEEMTKSDTAKRLKIKNEPPAAARAALINLCEYTLEHVRVIVREKWGDTAVVVVTSGYRCVALNTAVGGVNTSQHIKGEAGDIKVLVNGKEVPTEELYILIRGNKRRVEFDQLIQEFDDWVHISRKANGPQRMQCIRATKVNGKTKYTND